MCKAPCKSCCSSPFISVSTTTVWAREPIDCVSRASLPGSVVLGSTQGSPGQEDRAALVPPHSLPLFLPPRVSPRREGAAPVGTFLHAPSSGCWRLACPDLWVTAPSPSYCPSPCGKRLSTLTQLCVKDLAWFLWPWRLIRTVELSVMITGARPRSQTRQGSHTVAHPLPCCVTLASVRWDNNRSCVMGLLGGFKEMTVKQKPHTCGSAQYNSM